uniref:Globin family profile domain-containing protein n=1 Tax=Panagrolaimus sp. PS1159 TaxID=55785 RepID=A0AC35GU07_9BILA
MGNEHSSSHSGRTESPSSISSSITPGIIGSAGTNLEHPKIYKHRSLSPEKLSTPQRQARMSRYRASFRNGLPPPSSSNSSQPSTLVTINSGIESARLPRRTKSFRPGPGVQRSNSSQPSTLVTINSGIESARLPRRTKSFRPGPGVQRAPTSFRLPTCQITGLTIHQKSLITTKWKEMDRATEIEYCRNVFETLFKREPKFLRVIDLQDCEEWKIHTNLRIHIRQFCDMLSDVIKHLNDPQLCLNSIREFGSSYASEPSPEGCSSSPRPHVPSAFWETFIFALNNAAKDMQVETSSRSSEVSNFKV